MRRMFFAVLAMAAFGAVAAAPASGLVRHYEGKVITDPEKPTIEFDVVGIRKNHKFVPKRIKNLQIQPNLQYEYCPPCGGPTRGPYNGPGMTSTPTHVKKPRALFKFFDLYEIPCGIYTCERTAWNGKFSQNRRVVTGRVTQQRAAGGIEFGIASAADERFRAEF